MITPPFKIDDYAQEFWEAHAAELERQKVLTSQSRYSFALLCLTWSKVRRLSEYACGADYFREMGQLKGLHTSYHNLAKQFGLLPAAAKRDKLDQVETEAEDEFGL